MDVAADEDKDVAVPGIHSIWAAIPLPGGKEIGSRSYLRRVRHVPGMALFFIYAPVDAASPPRNTVNAPRTTLLPAALLPGHYLSVFTRRALILVFQQVRHLVLLLFFFVPLALLLLTFFTL